MADRVIVLYAGAAVEEAPAASFAAKELLQHPYTQALWQASPGHGFVPLPGTQPMGQLPEGCAFAPRCPKAGPECRKGAVAYEKRGAGHVRCLHPEGGNA